MSFHFKTKMMTDSINLRKHTARHKVISIVPEQAAVDNDFGDGSLTKTSFHCW